MIQKFFIELLSSENQVIRWKGLFKSSQPVIYDETAAAAAAKKAAGTFFL